MLLRRGMCRLFGQIRGTGWTLGGTRVVSTAPQLVGSQLPAHTQPASYKQLPARRSALTPAPRHQQGWGPYQGGANWDTGWSEKGATRPHRLHGDPSPHPHVHLGARAPSPHPHRRVSARVCIRRHIKIPRVSGEIRGCSPRTAQLVVVAHCSTALS